jgi:hypothetical protein
MRQPVNTLDESAAALHEMFLAYQRAGFTTEQAMQLVVAVVTRIAGNVDTNRSDD